MYQENYSKNNALIQNLRFKVCISKVVMHRRVNQTFQSFGIGNIQTSSFAVAVDKQSDLFVTYAQISSIMLNRESEGKHCQRHNGPEG